MLIYAISSPNTTQRPLVGITNPVIMLIKVDFPAPFLKENYTTIQRCG